MFSVFLSFATSILIQSQEEKSFVSWMRSNNCLFTGNEYYLRLGIFISNKRYTESMNSNRGLTYRVALNKFAATTPSEYRSLLTRRTKIVANSGEKSLKFGVNAKIGETSAKIGETSAKIGETSAKIGETSAKIGETSDKIGGKLIEATLKLPESIDWREKGAVNAVQDQGSCGSCWAFGTVQACESAFFIAGNKLLKCSEQNLVDCVKTCSGCGGGFEFRAIDHILNNQDGFLMGEAEYPYNGKDTNECQFDKISSRINKISSYGHGIIKDEAYLQQLIAQGVCDVAIDATASSFQLYSGGVYDNPDCTTFLNHAVGCVGYGVEKAKNGSESIEFWIVRNSWGTSWGEGGYIRMARNKESQCGIADDALQVYA